MKGYLVCVYKSISNEEKLKEYAVKARVAVEKYKGKILIRGGKSKNNEGEKELIEKIVKKCGSKEFENIDIFLNERQISNLNDCLKNLNDTDSIIANQLPFDLLSIEVRDGIKNLSRITGQELTEDLLNNIFSKFCIGK